jgi:hypothetical protein
MNYNIMRPTSFEPSVLHQYLRRHRIADLPELKHALGTDTAITVFRKLKQLGYLASYTHRGRFYTLPEIAISTIADSGRTKRSGFLGMAHCSLR